MLLAGISLQLGNVGDAGKALSYVENRRELLILENDLRY
jgi:hypothetical protein